MTWTFCWLDEETLLKPTFLACAESCLICVVCLTMQFPTLSLHVATGQALSECFSHMLSLHSLFGGHLQAIHQHSCVHKNDYPG